MGMFANMLAIRSCPRGEKMFAEFLKEVKERTLAAFENQEYPFEDLVNKVALNRDSSRNPLFDVGFSFQDLGFSPHGGAEHTGEVHEIEMPGLKLRPYEIGRRISKVDLTLIGMNVGDDLFFTFEYCTKLFERMTIELMKNGFFALIDSILQNTRCRIKDLDYRTSFEKELITNRDVEFSF
jgi:non-ribosomal peptide synthetase component F